MRIRGVQFSPVLGDVDRNLAFHIEAIEKAIADKIDLIVFPELSLTGYQLKDIVCDIAFDLAHPALREIERLSKKTAVIIGAPVEDPPGIIYNCALCYAGGRLLHIHQKTQLPNFGMFEEKMIYRGGNEFRAFKLKGFTVGLLVCREILFPVHGYLYYLQGTDLLIGISNSPFRGVGKSGFNSFEFWEKMGYVYSTFHHQNVLFVNRSGFEDGVVFGGGSFYAPAGMGIKIKARYFDDDLLEAVVKPGDTRRSRLSANYLRDEHPEAILLELQRIVHDRN